MVPRMCKFLSVAATIPWGYLLLILCPGKAWMPYLLLIVAFVKKKYVEILNKTRVVTAALAPLLAKERSTVCFEGRLEERKGGVGVDISGRYNYNTPKAREKTKLQFIYDTLLESNSFML